jgi:hypothetical protein
VAARFELSPQMGAALGRVGYPNAALVLGPRMRGRRPGWQVEKTAKAKRQAAIARIDLRRPGGPREACGPFNMAKVQDPATREMIDQFLRDEMKKVNGG